MGEKEREGERRSWSRIKVAGCAQNGTKWASPALCSLAARRALLRLSCLLLIPLSRLCATIP